MATPEQVQELVRRLQEGAEAQAHQAAQIAQLQGRLAAQQQRGQTGTATEFGSNRTIDTRVLGRPDHFEGIPGTWRDWSTVFRAYAAACEPRLESLMREVESKDAPQLMAVLNEDVRPISSQLYYMLIMLNKQQSLDRIVPAGTGEGLEAWRLLAQHHEPSSSTRFGRLADRSAQRQF